MRRHLMLATLGALLLAPVVATPAWGSGQPSSQESGNPINDQGSSYHYRTYITSITPKVSGLSVEVLEFADRLLLRNHTGKVVTVYGYEGEPYARVLPTGAAEQNARSPAVYLNTSFYANVTVPPSAHASAPPRWQLADRTAQFEWHDHRIHWMSPARPPQVKDPSKRTKIFDWRVPIRVGTQVGAIDGELFWVPENSKAPAGAIAAFVAILVAGVLAVVVVRRRRGRPQPPPAGGEPSAQREAW